MAKGLFFAIITRRRKYMGKFIDLTGKKFNQLTVLERDTSRKPGHGAYWRCQCDCGKIITVGTDCLNAGQISCGCHAHKVDMTSQVNKTYNYLTVLERDLSKGVGHGKDSYWICQCKCGNKTSVRLADLKRGTTKSCGCYALEQLTKRNQKDIAGMRSGMLVAIEPTGERSDHNDFLWRCKCDCGNENYICPASFILTQHAKSCGCKHRSFGEIEIANLLKDNQINYIDEYKFKDFYNYNTSPLRYDFAIIDNNNTVLRLIEFDGEQHYRTSSNFWSPKQIRNDKLKNQYAKEHNIPLVRIPYTKLGKITLEDIMGEEFIVT